MVIVFSIFGIIAGLAIRFFDTISEKRVQKEINGFIGQYRPYKWLKTVGDIITAISAITALIAFAIQQGYIKY